MRGLSSSHGTGGRQGAPHPPGTQVASWSPAAAPTPAGVHNLQLHGAQGARLLRVGPRPAAPDQPQRDVTSEMVTKAGTRQGLSEWRSKPRGQTRGTSLPCLRHPMAPRCPPKRAEPHEALEGGRSPAPAASAGSLGAPLAPPALCTCRPRCQEFSALFLANTPWVSPQAPPPRSPPHPGYTLSPSLTLPPPQPSLSPQRWECPCAAASALPAHGPAAGATHPGA